MELLDKDGATPLHRLVMQEDRGSASMVRELQVAGADVNAKDNEGVTCLAMCADTDQGPDRILRTQVESLLASMPM